MRRLLTISGFVIFFVAAISAIAIYRGNMAEKESAPLSGIGGAPPTTTPNEAEQNQQSQTIVEELEKRGNFTIYLEALRTTGLLERLSGPERFTVFAPTDDAFVKVNSEILYPVLTDRDSLRSLVAGHIVRGEVISDRFDEVDRRGMQSIDGETLDISDEIVNGSGISTTDIETGNGVIHIVDDVILPITIREALTPTTTI